MEIYRVAGIVSVCSETEIYRGSLQTPQYSVQLVVAIASEQKPTEVCRLWRAKPEAALQTANTPHRSTAGIYTIPEISMVGKTEAQLTRAGVSYEVGLADYREVRGEGGGQGRGERAERGGDTWQREAPGSLFS